MGSYINCCHLSSLVATGIFRLIKLLPGFTRFFIIINAPWGHSLLVFGNNYIHVQCHQALIYWRWRFITWGFFLGYITGSPPKNPFTRCHVRVRWPYLNHNSSHSLKCMLDLLGLLFGRGGTGFSVNTVNNRAATASYGVPLPAF